MYFKFCHVLVELNHCHDDNNDNQRIVFMKNMKEGSVYGLVAAAGEGGAP